MADVSVRGAITRRQHQHIPPPPQQRHQQLHSYSHCTTKRKRCRRRCSAKQQPAGLTLGWPYIYSHT